MLNSTKNEESITRVKHIVYSSNDTVVQTGAIDTLATFGEQAVDAITEVISPSNISDGVKEHGLKTIEYIKENSVKFAVDLSVHLFAILTLIICKLHHLLNNCLVM